MEHRGGTFIGQGSFGCAFRPAIPCRRVKWTGSDDTVGKIFTVGKEFDDEMAVTRVLNEIDPDHKLFLFPSAHCGLTMADVRRHEPPHEIQRCKSMENGGMDDLLRPVFQAVSPYGGIALNHYMRQRTGTMSRADLVHMFERLFYGIQHLLRHKRVHQDIKVANIVASDKGIRIIDFGLMRRFDEFYDDNPSLSYRNGVNPPEYWMAGMHRLEFTRPLLSVIAANSVPFMGDHEFDASQTRHFGQLVSLITRPPYTSKTSRLAYLRQERMHTKSDIYSLGMVLVYCSKYLKAAEDDVPSQVRTFDSLVRSMMEPDFRRRATIGDLISRVKGLVKFSTFVPYKEEKAPTASGNFDGLFSPPTKAVIPCETLRDMRESDTYKAVPRGFNKSTLCKRELCELLRQRNT